ncbi:MAG: excinuclease ABC subunit UvrC [Chloroflexi bacterium]|nr:excinuclease ABC subunit UvrC [Chloroflexota bacterium]
MAASLLERLKAVPQRPGVYLFRNEQGKVVYVGKAAQLRTRMRNYFGAPQSMEAKVRNLRAAIADFEYIVTHTEQEALHLEATLVKRHQPHFNVRLKDDKHYPYLKVDLRDGWPRIYITRRVEKDGGRYFGPYASAGSVRKMLDISKKLFPWRSCTKVITGDDPRPCLEYYIHRCIAPCTSYCSKDEYDKVIRQTILFLEGRTDEVVRDLNRQMQEASQNMAYERAANLRDQVRAIERVTERQTVASTKPADEDIFGLARTETDAAVQVLFVRGTKLINTDHFTLDGAKDAADGEVLASFLQQFYESATYIPRRLLLPCSVPEAELLQAWLSERRGGRVQLVVPQRGEKRRLIEMAQTNAQEALEQARAKWLADAGKTQAALDELQEELNLPAPPRRIECYDISNIQGTNAVGSMVVFVDGQPRPQLYRRFKIGTVEGANDFAMLAEVLKRRFKKATAPVERSRESPAERDGRSPANDTKAEAWRTLPDLLIVDGGKGQLGAAIGVLQAAGLEPIVPVAGLAKRNEELFVKDEPEPIVLPRTSQALYLVQRVRDEAHRFAITYHRGLRGKRSIQSALDEVPGVGPKRKKALLRKFGSVKGIRAAPVEEIAATAGFTQTLAAKVKELV